MDAYRVTDSEGNNWGYIAAERANEAVQIVYDDASANPDNYNGTPRGLRATAA